MSDAAPRPPAEALVSDGGGGVVCSREGAPLEPIVRKRIVSAGKRRKVIRETIGWRCPRCGAGFNSSLSRDHSLDRRRGRGDSIGVDRKWLQCPGTHREHFDICQSKRAEAIERGAIPITKVDLVRKIVQREPE